MKVVDHPYKTMRADIDLLKKQNAVLTEKLLTQQKLIVSMQKLLELNTKQTQAVARWTDRIVIHLEKILGAIRDARE